MSYTYGIIIVVAVYKVLSKAKKDENQINASFFLNIHPFTGLLYTECTRNS